MVQLDKTFIKAEFLFCAHVTNGKEEILWIWIQIIAKNLFISLLSQSSPLLKIL